MNWKTATPLILAVLMGLVAAKLGRDLVVRGRSAASRDSKLVKLVVSKADLRVGHTLAEEDLAVAGVSADAVPRDHFADAGDVVGRVLVTPVVKGQTILESTLAPAGSGTGPQALVPPGMRAVSVEVNEVSGLTGLLTPGCRVDVVCTLQDKRDDRSVARTIVENVKVLAVGQRLSMTGDANKDEEAAAVAKSVTLLVTPRDAEAIELASNAGRTRLVMRSPLDSETPDHSGLTVDALLGRGRKDSAAEWMSRWIESAKNAAPARPVATTLPPEKPVEATPAVRPPEPRWVEVIRNGVATKVAVEKPIENKLDEGTVLTNSDRDPAVPGRMP